MSKHDFVPISIPLYSNYKSKSGEEENYTLPIIGVDVEHNDDGSVFVVPLEINEEGFIEEAGLYSRLYDITISGRPEYD